VTGAINTQSSSQDLVNRQVSLVTGSIHFVTGAFNAFTGSVVGQTNTIATFTSSVNFATQSLNTQTGSQELVNLRIASTTGSINTTTSSFDLVFRGISSVTGAINLTTSSLIGITNGLMAFTAALDNTYATDAQLYQLYQATASIHSTTASLNTQTGSQDLVNRGISSVTGSINTTTSSFNNVFLGISSVTGAINTQSSSQDLVNLGISSVTGSLIGIANGLMAFTAALDNTYATDAQLYQLYQSTASIHFATQSLNTQTGSQDLVNLGISTFTGSLRSEVNLIEAYTASLKAAGIVSSSQQITNYYKFAETASANTFYGNQTFASSGGSGLRVYGGSGTHQWDIYLNGQNVRLSDNTVGDGAVRIDQRLDVGGHVTASGNISVGTDSFTSPNGADRFVGVYSGQDSSIILQDSVETWEMYMNDDLYFTTGSTSPKNVISLRRGTGNVEINEGNLSVDKGNVIIGTSGKGIDFSATSNGSGTTSSELLNDYEEGTFTPSFTGTGLTINTYGNRAGFYTKVGRLVTVTINIMTESVTAVGTEAVKIGGLPFTANNTAESTNAANIFNSARWNANPPISADVNLGTTEINLYSDRGPTGAGTDPTTAKTTDMATGTGNRNMVRLTATYFV
jgi:hypothetical protein